MAGLRDGLPAGGLSLTPAFVPWAALCATLLLIAGAIGWLVWHGALGRRLRRLWLADLVAAWLAYAALYHLASLALLRPVLGQPWALWLLCAGLGGYGLLRRLPSPLRRPEAALGWAVLLWAGLIAAGQGYLQETQADADLLAARPQAVLTAQAPELRPLWRALLFTRLEPAERDATASLLALLQAGGPAGAPPDPALLSAFRLGQVPRLLAHYRYDLAKLRTYQWLQGALLGAVLLVWGFGHLPEWEAG